MKFTDDDKKIILQSFSPPFFLVIVIWMVHLFQVISGISLGTWGIYPLTLDGMKGILFAPLLHADFNHLINNTIPLFLLTSALYYFYHPIALKLIILIWFVTGLCVWISGRDAYHIGASGLIYGEASFLFFSGVIRRNIKLSAISLLVIFLYGGMVWGIFPVFHEISWESHLFGGVAGLTFAFIYKDEGPADEYVLPEDEENEDTDFDNGEPEKFLDEPPVKE